MNLIVSAKFFLYLIPGACVHVATCNRTVCLRMCVNLPVYARIYNVTSEQ